MFLQYDSKALTAFAAQVHIVHREAGWWTSVKTGEFYKRPWSMLRVLIVTELAEAVEGTRKNLMDDKLPHRPMPEVEMADAAIRVLDAIGGHDASFHTDPDRYTSATFMEMVQEAISREDHLDSYLIDQMLIHLYYPYNSYSTTEEANGVINTSQEVNLSLLLWHIIEYCKYKGYDLDGAVREKMEYNAKRADHRMENRKLSGGKVW